MYKSIAIIVVAFVSYANLVQAQSVDISSADNFEVINRHVIVHDSANKKIVHLDAAEGDGVAWLKTINFSTGIIEMDVMGKDVMQQSFVGIAFHGIDDSSFDAVYFRPFNFLAADAIRKSHSVQYICLPKYEWSYLRENFPGKYENALTQSIEPSSWFHVRVVVEVDKISAYVNNDNTPSLVVKPLANYTTGKIGFWVGNGSDGDFSNLTVLQH